MSIRTLCDACNKVISGTSCRVEVKVVNRYRPVHEQENRDSALIDLCEGCDMKVAEALKPLLPQLAGRIEPNVFATGGMP